MTQRRWFKAVKADFSTAADWTGGVVPGASDEAILDPSGAGYHLGPSRAASMAAATSPIGAMPSICTSLFCCS